MSQLLIIFFLSLVSFLPTQGKYKQIQEPDLSGYYRLVKGKLVYEDKSALMYIRGTLVIERLDTSSFAYYGALTPKKNPTVGCTGIYAYRQGQFIAEFPNREEAQPAGELKVSNDTLFVVSRYVNAVDSLVWKRVLPETITDKYQLRQIKESRKLFDYQKDFPIRLGQEN